MPKYYISSGKYKLIKNCDKKKEIDYIIAAMTFCRRFYFDDANQSACPKDSFDPFEEFDDEIKISEIGFEKHKEDKSIDTDYLIRTLKDLIKKKLSQ